MRTRILIVLACLALVATTLPFQGCGDNDNSVALPCCPICGDDVCSGDERPCNCRGDCSRGDQICAAIVPVCGDGACQREANPGESHERCPADCALDCRQCDDRF